MKFSSNLSDNYTKWCAQTFQPIFVLFAIFDHNFAKIAAPPSDECENCVVHLNEESLVKKTLKTSTKTLTIYSNAMLVRTMHPRTHGALDSERDKKKNKHHIFAPTAGARSAIFLQLCTVIELVLPIKKGDIHFSIQRIVFPTRCTEKCRLIYRCAVSQQ